MPLVGYHPWSLLCYDSTGMTKKHAEDRLRLGAANIRRAQARAERHGPPRPSPSATLILASAWPSSSQRSLPRRLKTVARYPTTTKKHGVANEPAKPTKLLDLAQNRERQRKPAFNNMPKRPKKWKNGEKFAGHVSRFTLHRGPLRRSVRDAFLLANQPRKPPKPGKIYRLSPRAPNSAKTKSHSHGLPILFLSVESAKSVVKFGPPHRGCRSRSRTKSGRYLTGTDATLSTASWYRPRLNWSPNSRCICCRNR